ncbi:MAG: hypothetical protein IT258_21450 [Saprospiraceae bacterium]|nr:hypothetical protein [Saprospiraceae bacterium]
MKKLMFITMLLFGAVLNTQAQTSPCLGENCINYAFVNETGLNWTISVGPYFSTTVPAGTTVAGAFSESDEVTHGVYSKVVGDSKCMLWAYLTGDNGAYGGATCDEPPTVTYTWDDTLLTVLFQ